LYGALRDTYSASPVCLLMSKSWWGQCVLVMRAIFSICANEIQPGLLNSQKLAGRCSPLGRTFVKKIWLLRLRTSTSRENANAPDFTELFPTTPDDRGGLLSMIWFRISFLGISPGGCHCFPITPDFAVRWETLTVCPRFHSVSGRKRHVRAKCGDLVILSCYPLSEFEKVPFVNTVKPGLTATSVIRSPCHLPLGKTAMHFLPTFLRKTSC